MLNIKKMNSHVPGLNINVFFVTLQSLVNIIIHCAEFERNNRTLILF